MKKEATKAYSKIPMHLLVSKVLKFQTGSLSFKPNENNYSQYKA